MNEAIAEATARFAEAIRLKDRVQIEGMYTEDAILLPSHHPMVIGRTAIGAFWEKRFPPKGVEIRSALDAFEIVPCGEEVIECGRATIMLHRGAESELVDQGKYMVLWRLEAGEWRMARDMINSDLPPR